MIEKAGLCCLRCGAPLERVTQAPNSALNRDQFEAIRAGKYFTTCRENPICDNAKRGIRQGYAYFWDSEVEKP